LVGPNPAREDMEDQLDRIKDIRGEKQLPRTSYRPFDDAPPHLGRRAK
jgi:hypothetical protein